MREPALAKIIRYFIYAVAFVPLIIFKDYISPFHFGKVVIFRSIVEVMIALFILLVWRDRSYLPKINTIGWAFLSFALAFSIATITSVIPYLSFWGSLERMGGVFTFWHYFAYFIILTSIFRKESDWINLFRLVIIIGVASAFYGFGQKTDWSWVVGSGGRSRIFGTIGNAALFAGYQIICAFLGLMLFFRKDNSLNWRMFYGSSSLIIFIAAFMTAVRGSLLAIGVGVLSFALLYSAAYRSKKARKVLLGLVAFFLLFVVSSLLMKDTSLVQSSGYLRRVTDFSLNNYTIQTRFWAWQAGINGWNETPKTILFGWGPENFNVPFSKYFNPKFFQGPGSETLFDRAHNMFVEILVTMGLLGLLAYLGIFASSFRVLWKKIHERETVLYGVGLIPLLIAYAIHNSFIFDTSANFIVFFTILGFISQLNQARPFEAKSAEVRSHKINKTAWSFSAIILLILSAITVYQINILSAVANYTTTRAIVAGWSKDFAGAIAKYKEALAYDTPGKYEYRNRLAQHVLEQTASGPISPEELEAIKFAISEEKKNIEENEMDYLPYLYAARLYVTLGKGDPVSEYNDQALELSLQALKISPTFVRAYYELGQAYLNKRDLGKAAEVFKKATELNPEVGLSAWYWGVVEMERGNTNLGLDIIEKTLSAKLYAPAEGDLAKLVNVYFEKGDFSKLVWIYEMLIKANPTNPQYRASLAVAYSRIGRLDDAAIQAKKAAELDPKFETEAKAFLQSIGR